MQNIAIVTEKVTHRNMEVVKGIYDFAKTTPDWNLHEFICTSKHLINSFLNWGAQGVVALVGVPSDALVHALRFQTVPVVAIGRHPVPFPRIRTNLASVAKICAKQFPSKKFSRIGYLAQTEIPGLLDALANEFGERLCHRHVALGEMDLIASKPRQTDALSKWIQGNELTAVIAGCDLVAVYLLRSANFLGIAVPEKLSILSVRESLTCGLPTNELTAIVEPNLELGYQAARSLDRLMNGYPLPAQPILVDAKTVVERSTTPSHDSDRNIDRAIRFIDENATRCITVSDLMKFQTNSRVTFERKFRQQVGCSPGDQIRKVRLSKAKELLSSTSDSISMIGTKCGFDSTNKFSSFFTAAAGISPRQFRHSVQKK